MDIAFRVDASLEIGTGHVMRCLTLASRLRRDNARCRFVCRDVPGNLLDLIRQRGFLADSLPAGDIVPRDVHHPVEALSSDWEADASQTAALLGGTCPDWLIVDHYGLDARWQGALRRQCLRLMVIDDLANRPHDCDLLLDQNLGRTNADYASFVPAGCAILTGPSFALLQEQFSEWRDYSLQRRSAGRLTRLLIAMGGVDAENATTRVLNSLREATLPQELKIAVVMGQHAPWRSEVAALATTMPRETTLLVNVSNMAELMASSDLAIGAAGTTSWERCCLGLPSLILILAENQAPGGLALARANCSIVLEDTDKLDEALNLALTNVSSPNVLRAMAADSSQVTDGRGATRVAINMATLNEFRSMR